MKIIGEKSGFWEKIQAEHKEFLKQRWTVLDNLYEDVLALSKALKREMKNSQIHSKDKDWDSAEKGKQRAAQFSFLSPKRPAQITPF